MPRGARWEVRLEVAPGGGGKGGEGKVLFDISFLGLSDQPAGSCFEPKAAVDLVDLMMKMGASDGTIPAGARGDHRRELFFWFWFWFWFFDTFDFHVIEGWMSYCRV